jgi:hypothetical protein
MAVRIKVSKDNAIIQEIPLVPLKTLNIGVKGIIQYHGYAKASTNQRKLACPCDKICCERMIPVVNSSSSHAIVGICD